MAATLSSLFGAQPAKIAIKFADADSRAVVTTKPSDGRGGTEQQYLFAASDNIIGTVDIAVNGGKKLDHQGIKVELIGQIELLHDRSSTYEFTSLVRELEVPGELQGSKAFPFEFTSVEKQYESYDGINVRLRYFLRVTIMRQYAKVVHE